MTKVHEKEWTRADYEFWLKVRSPHAGDWAPKDCCKADQLIRQTAIKNFYSWCASNLKDREVREFMMTMVRCHFGSTNVDALLTHLHCYPDWMGE